LIAGTYALLGVLMAPGFGRVAGVFVAFSVLGLAATVLVRRTVRPSHGG
jgi:hypothetical protein